MEISMGTYKFVKGHLHSKNCKWCKAVATKRQQRIEREIERQWQNKDKKAGLVIYGAFLLALIVVVI